MRSGPHEGEQPGGRLATEVVQKRGPRQAADRVDVSSGLSLVAVLDDGDVRVAWRADEVVLDLQKSSVRAHGNRGRV